jgi:hypothetical protein
MSLKSYVSKEPSSQLLKEGEHIVTLASVIECTSFDAIQGMKISGKKTTIFPWINPTEEFAGLLVSSDGVLTFRQNMKGWKRYSELNDKELQSGKYEDKQGFACLITEAGLVRVEDPERTAVCERIVDYFLFAIGVEPGTNAQEGIDKAIAGKTKFKVNVNKEPWTDEVSGEMRDQYRVTKWMRLDEQPVNADATKFHDIEA